MANSGAPFVVLASLYPPSSALKTRLVPPFGLMMVGAALLRSGIRCAIMHREWNDETKRVLADVCRKAITVGFYTITGESILPTLEASRLVKEAGVKVVWGGPHATLLPEVCLGSEDCVDIVVRGEGEISLPKLVWLLDQGGDVAAVPGVCLRGPNHQLIIGPIPPLISGEDLLPPDWDLANVEDYLTGNYFGSGLKQNHLNRVLPLITSKGCKHNCAFCYNVTVNRRRFRGFNTPGVVDGIVAVRDRYMIDGFHIYDDCFFTDERRAYTILEALKRPFFAETRIDMIDENTLAKLAGLGCHTLYVGVETGSDKMLKLIGKRISSSDCVAAASMASKYGIALQMSLMVCMPDETVEDVIQTHRLVQRLKQLDSVFLDGPKFFDPYPGTRFYRRMIALGWSPPRTNEAWARITRHTDPIVFAPAIPEDVRKAAIELFPGITRGAAPATYDGRD